MKTNVTRRLLQMLYLSASVRLLGGDSRLEDSPLEVMARATASIQSGNTEAIKEAYRDASRYIFEPTAQAWNQLPRREKIVFSLRMLDGITSCMEERKYSAEDRPYLNVGAPGVPVAGMDPKQITDPEIRREYERRIEENRQKIERIRATSLFQHQKKLWVERVQYLARELYGKSHDEVAELKELLDTVVADASLRIELEKSLGITSK